MEDLVFWRDMEAQFLEPADRAFDLHAMLVAPDLPKIAAEVGRKTIELMQDPSSSLDTVYRMGIACGCPRVEVEGCEADDMYCRGSMPAADRPVRDDVFRLTRFLRTATIVEM